MKIHVLAAQDWMSAIQIDSAVPSSGVSSYDSVSISTSQQLASIAGRSVRVVKKQGLFFYFVVSLHYFFCHVATWRQSSTRKKAQWRVGESNRHPSAWGNRGTRRMCSCHLPVFYDSLLSAFCSRISSKFSGGSAPPHPKGRCPLDPRRGDTPGPPGWPDQLSRAASGPVQ